MDEKNGHLNAYFDAGMSFCNLKIILINFSHRTANGNAFSISRYILKFSGVDPNRFAGVFLIFELCISMRLL